jgi:hypothetical protein
MNTGHIKIQDVTLYATLNLFLNRSDGLRYRVQEYDVNRDPRGPISATLEVLYGLITDLVAGISRIPGQIVSIFPGSQPSNTMRDYRGREWAMRHFAECLSNQEPRRDAHAVVDTNTAGENLVNHEEALHEDPHEADANIGVVANEEMAECHETPPVENGATIQRGLGMEEGKTNTNKKLGYSKQALSSTGYQAAKIAKYTLAFAIVLPTDTTLSLSKGFHNAPKLYHDVTVQPIPRVIGIKSGFRAAGTVRVYCECT